MKKNLFLWFSVLFTNFLLAQNGSVEITGVPLVEVGMSNFYFLKFIPAPPPLPPSGVTHR